MLQLSDMVSANQSQANASIETKFFKVVDPNQKTYTLTSSVKSDDHAFVFLNGRHLHLTDYTINARALTLLNVNLEMDDVIYVVHFRSVVVDSGRFTSQSTEEFVGGSLSYILAYEVSSPTDIIVSVNGLIINPSDYTIENSRNLIFTTITQPNAKIVVIYLNGAIVTTTSVFPNSVTLSHLALESIDTHYAKIENTYHKNEIDAKISEIVNSAPDLLNSLSEISNAINNDPNFATTIDTKLANKSNIDHTHSDTYYTKHEVDLFLALKAKNTDFYNAGQINTILGEKANLSDVYTKSEVESLIQSGGTISIPVTPGNRGIFSGGVSLLEVVDKIEYFSIDTFGNSVVFGNLFNAIHASASSSNGIGNTGLIGGGYNENSISAIQKINILNVENAIIFGELAAPRSQHCAVNNGSNNRTVWIGGVGSFNSDMEFSTTNTPGTANAFGDILGTEKLNLAGTSNGTHDRGIFATTVISNIKSTQFITIPTQSNSVAFGNCNTGTKLTAVSNDTHDRGVFAGGLEDGVIALNKIEFVNITLPGNSENFGILTISRSGLAGTSNGINQRAIFAGGINSDSTFSSEVDFINISINANAAPFGDLLNRVHSQSAMSNAFL